MPQAIRVYSRIQDMNDFSGSPSNGAFLVYDSSTGAFVQPSSITHNADGTLTVTGTSENTPFKIDYTGDGDSAFDITGGHLHMSGGKSCLTTEGSVVIFGLDVMNGTNTEDVRLQWSADNSQYEIITEAAGTGVIRPIALKATKVVVQQTSGSSNIQEWQNSSGTVMTSIASNGAITLTNTADNTSPTVLTFVNGGSGGLTGAKIQFPYSSVTGSYGGITLSTAASGDELYVGSGRITFTGSDLQLATGGSHDVTIFNSSGAGYKTIFKAPGDVEFRTYSGIDYTTKLTVQQDGTVLVNGFGAATKGLIVKGAGSQTANLQEWQSSGGTALSYVDNTGNLYLTQSGAIAATRYLTDQNNDVAYMDTAATGGYAWRLTNRVASNKAFTIVGAASQSANLQEWQDSAASALSYVSSDGSLTVRNIKIGLNDSSQSHISLSSGTTEAAATLRWDGVNTYLNTPSSKGIVLAVANSTALYVGSDKSVLVNGFGSSIVGLTVKGAVSQTAHLQEWQNSSGVVLVSVQPDGANPATGELSVTGNSATGLIRLHGETGIHLATYTNSRQIIFYDTVGSGGDAGLGKFGSGMIQVTDASTGYGGLIAKTLKTRAASSTSYNALEVQDSAGVARAWIDVTGQQAELVVGDIYNVRYVGVGVAPSTAAQLQVVTDSASRKPLIVKGATSQTANLQEWQNVGGTPLAYIDKDGKYNGDGSALANLPGAATGSYASRPAAGTAGKLYLPTDGSGLIYADNGSAWKGYMAYGPLVPPIGDFTTWVNQGSRGSIVETSGVAILKDVGPHTGGENVIGRVKNLPGSTWTMTLVFRCNFPPGSNTNCGILLRESSSGKVQALALATNFTLNCWNWTNPTTFNGAVFNDVWYYGANEIAMLRIRCDGTNLYYEYSMDFTNWYEHRRLTLSGSYLSGADQAGFYYNALGFQNSNQVGSIIVYHASVV